MQAATKALAPYLKPPTSIGVSQRLKRVPRGDRIDYLECAQPSCVSIAAGVSQAAAALGMRVTDINSGATPASLGQAWAQVMATPPNAVVVPGFPTAFEMSQLQAMKAKHIPVVTIYTNDAPGLTTNIVGPQQFAEFGTAMGNYVVDKSGGDAQAVVLQNADVPGLTGQLTAMQKVFARNCPKCHLAVLDVPLTGIGTTIPTQVVSYLQQNPSTNWIILNTGDFAAGVPEAVRAAGLTNVAAIATADDRLVYEYIKHDELIQSNLSVSLDYVGWRAIDAVARRLVGQAVDANAYYPSQFLSAKQLTFDLNGSWPSTPGYQQQFKKLWGVG